MAMAKKLAGAKRSLTIWFNGLALALLPAFQFAHDNVAELRDYLGEGTFKTVGLVIVVGNLLLRFKTTKGLDEK